jgi:hypothetical protein
MEEPLKMSVSLEMMPASGVRRGFSAPPVMKMRSWRGVRVGLAVGAAVEGDCVEGAAVVGVDVVGVPVGASVGAVDGGAGGPGHRVNRVRTIANVGAAISLTGHRDRSVLRASDLQTACQGGIQRAGDDQRQRGVHHDAVHARLRGSGRGTEATADDVHSRCARHRCSGMDPDHLIPPPPRQNSLFSTAVAASARAAASSTSWPAFVTLASVDELTGFRCVIQRYEPVPNAPIWSPPAVMSLLPVQA